MRIKQIYVVYFMAFVFLSCSPLRFNAKKEKAVPPPPCENETCTTSTGPTVWMAGEWGACSQACGGGTHSRPVSCINTVNQILPDTQCKELKPPSMQACNTLICGASAKLNPEFAAINIGPWGICSVACGGGTHTRLVECRKSSGVVSDSLCPTDRPSSSEECNTQNCQSGAQIKIKTVTVTPVQNQVDILLVLDDSSSMTPDITKLAFKLNSLINTMEAQNVDWQMCLTTTDVGYHQGRPIYWSGLNSHIINSDSSNLAVVLKQTLADIGGGYSNDEQGIKAAIYSVLNNAEYPCYRTGASLAVIIVSDEDERSVGGTVSLSSQQYQELETQNYPATYINTARAVFGGDKRIVVNSIVVKDNKCKYSQDAQGSLSFIGTKYIELADLTGGQNLSICDDDYATNVNYIWASIEKSLGAFELECAPFGAANVKLPDNISYALSGKHISFTPVLPVATTVTVTYQCLNNHN